MNQTDNWQFLIKNKNKKATFQAILSISKGQDYKDLAQAFHGWNWTIRETTNGDVTTIAFLGEKLHDNYYFFKTISPFIEKGSFIEMMGEDHLSWRWYFDGQKCKEIYPTIVWDMK